MCIITKLLTFQVFQVFCTLLMKKFNFTAVSSANARAWEKFPNWVQFEIFFCSYLIRAELKIKVYFLACLPDTLAQSICTHYSCFENMGRFVTLENKGPKYGLQKAGCKKKQGHCYSKREEARLPLLFLSNNDPVFLHPAFCNPYFGPFFKSSRA